MTKKALTLALEALEKERPYLGARPALTSKAITAIKEALSELEQDDEVLGFNGWGFPIEKPSQPEQEPIEDLQAKLKWATEQLEANINWEFVAAAKEEMLKAAWAEIKELREQIKELDQEPVAKAVVNKRNTDENQITNIDLTLTEAGKRLPSGEHRLYTTPPQHSAIARKPLTDEQIAKEVEAELTHYWNGEYIDTTGARDQLKAFARAIEAKLKEKNNGS